MIDSLNLNGRRVYDLSSFEVEDIARLILEEKLDREYFVNKTKAHYPDDSISDSVVQKIDFAFQRISKPLSLEEKITFMVVPFGVVHRLYKNDLFNARKERQMGFKKRVNDYYLFSMIGFTLYLLGAILIPYFF